MIKAALKTFNKNVIPVAAMSFAVATLFVVTYVQAA